MLGRFQSWLFTPKDNSPLVLFRALLGLLLFLESFGALLTGWVRRTFVESKMTIPFNGFDWLATLLHGEIMYVWYGLLSLFGIGIMLGYKYKWSVAGYGIFWTCTYLIQKTHYNNHYYLMIIICAVMLLLPAQRYFSLDARNPNKRSLSCPNWCYFLLIGLFWIVYTYASANKIYPAWLASKPISMWFGAKTDYWLIGPLLGQDWMPPLISYGGIFFDGLIIPALLWKRTRKFAFWLNIPFHLFNSVVFQIGIFPYLMIAITVLFFPPEQIRTLFFRQKPVLTEENAGSYRIRPFVTYSLLAFLLLNVLLPVRHHLFPGHVLHTEEGHRMSWRMMLRSRSGNIQIKWKHKETRKPEYVDLKDYLSSKQIRCVATHPDALYWFLQKIKKDYLEKGWDLDQYDLLVRCTVSVNREGYFDQYDPLRDMKDVEWHFFSHDDWILYPDEDEG